MGTGDIHAVAGRRVWKSIARCLSSHDDVRVLLDGRLEELAHRLAAMTGVIGVMLGGSRARGDHTVSSDVDLGLYYRLPLDVEGLRVLAREVTGTDVEVTEPGAWGPWVDGGAWLSVDGTAVDWIYRDLDRAHACWEEARTGRFDFHAQVGHPLGVASFSYAGEVALGRVLVDPSGELTALQDATGTFPPALRSSVVDRLWEAGFTLDIARKGASRGDVTYVAGCLLRAIELCAHALHANAGRWLINEKGAVAAAGLLPQAPEKFAERARGLLANLGDDATRLDAAITSAARLIEDVQAACSPSR